MIISEHDETLIREFVTSLSDLDTSDWSVSDTVIIRIRSGSSRSTARTLFSGLEPDGLEIEEVVTAIAGRISRYGLLRQRVFIEAMKRTVTEGPDGRRSTQWVHLDHVEVSPEPDASFNGEKPTWQDLYEVKGVESLARAVVSMAAASEQRATDAWAASIGFAEKYMAEATERMRERAEGMVAAAEDAAGTQRMEAMLEMVAPHLPALLAVLASWQPQPAAAPETEGDEHAPEATPPEQARLGAALLAGAVEADPSVATDAAVLGSLAQVVGKLDSTAKQMIVALLKAE